MSTSPNKPIDIQSSVSTEKDGQRFLESVFERIPGMIYLHDLVADQNLYRSWSLKRVLGYQESTVLNSGKEIRGLVHADDRHEFVRAAKELKVAKDGECVRFTYRMKHQNGSWLWFQSEEYVYERNANGEPTKCLGYTTDLTSTKQQQQELDQLNQVNQFLLNAARILSQPDKDYKVALQELAVRVSIYLNAVCDISILDSDSGIIKPEALYHQDPEVMAIIADLFKRRSVKKGEGMVGSVIETGNEILINEVPERMKVGPRGVDPRIIPRSLMYVPLKGSRNVLGSMNLSRLEGQKSYTKVEIDQMRRLGSYVSLFVENGMLKEIQRHEVQLRSMAEKQLEAEKKWAEFKLEISHLLANADAGFKKIIEQLAKRVAEYFDVVCDVQLVDEESGLINMVAVYHKDKAVKSAIEYHLTKRQLKRGEGMVGAAVATGKEFFMPQLSDELRQKTVDENVDPIIVPTSFIYIPLKSHGKVLGTLDLTRLSDQQALTEDELVQMRDLANHASQFVEIRMLQAEQKKEIELRKKAEQRNERTTRLLERMEAETRSILNTIPIYISKISKDFRYLFLNETYLNMGVDPRKMEGRSIFDVLGKTAADDLEPYFKRVLNGEVVNYDYDRVMADGVHRYFNVALAPDRADNGEVIGFYSCSSDVTTKVEAENQIKLSQDRLETLSLNSGDAFFFHDIEQNILDVNQVATEMLGYSREEFLRMKAHLIDPVWKGKNYQKFIDLIDANVPQTFETTVYAKDGSKIPVEVRFVKRKEGANTYIQSLVRDRTNKRDQELKLQRSEERLRLIFNNIEDYIAIVDENGVFESINKVSQGLSIDDVVGTKIYDFYDSEEKVEFLVRNFNLLKETGKTFGLTDTYTGPDGTKAVYSRKFIGIFHGEKFYKAILIIRDVTAEKDREHAEMNAVLRGQEQERKRLGAELHDGIGQVLSAIALQVSLIREEITEENVAEITNDLSSLNSNLQQAIREVRNISHDLMPEVLESFGLEEAINQTCNNLHDRTGIKVQFDHVDLEDRYDQHVEVNLYRITQELLNNIHKHASCKNVFVSLIDHGKTLNLTVEDDGEGFDIDGDFKGIGLSNVYSRVNMMGGEIDVESAANSGTLINIEVPKQLE